MQRQCYCVDSDKWARGDEAAFISKAMQAAVQHISHNLESCTVQNLEDAECNDKLKLLKDMATLMEKQTFSWVLQPSTEQLVDKVWLNCFRCNLELLVHMRVLLSHGDAEQQVESDDSEETVTALRSHLKNISIEPWLQGVQIHDSLPTRDVLETEFKFAWFKSMPEHFAEIVKKAETMVPDYVAKYLEPSKDLVRKAHSAVAELSGGVGDGSLWKEALDDAASWDDVLKVAETTVFDKVQRGMTKRAKAARAAVLAAVGQVELHAGKVDESLSDEPSWQEFKASVDNDLTQLQVTLSECKVMHNIARGQRTAAAQRRQHVDDEMVAMTALNDRLPGCAHKMHPAIKAAAHEFLRS